MAINNQKPKVIWLRSRGQKIENSANELAEETLQGTDLKIEPFGRFPLVAALRAYRASRCGAKIYFQFGAPGENLAVAVLVAAGCPVITHYLDQIAEGYPRWSKMLRLHEIIHFILRRSKLVLAISPAMKTDIEMRLGRKGPVKVKFRVKPDSALVVRDAVPLHNDAVIFAGNINLKTNFDALLTARVKLQSRNLRLVVHTRTKSPELLKKLDAAGVEIRPAVPANLIVEHSFDFCAQLLPFNLDVRSKAFFCTSTPSKLPNLIMARRRILYLGPSDFWIRNWLAAQGDILIDLECDDAGTTLDPFPVSRRAAQQTLSDFCALSDTLDWDAF